MNFKNIPIHKLALLALLFVIILFIVIVVSHNRKMKVDYDPTVYEKEVIEYFKEVALNSDFYDNTQKVIKWKKPMYLYLYKDDEQVIYDEFIKKFIREINNEIKDSFKIVLTENSQNSNAIMYLCSRDEIKRIDPTFSNILDDINKEEEYIMGFAYTEYELSNFSIFKSKIYINTNESIGVQESTILEELTQSIGLMSDSDKYQNSIFYENKSEENLNPTELAKIDKELINFLYNPKMKSGMNAKQAERIILKILKDKAENTLK